MKKWFKGAIVAITAAAFALCLCACSAGSSSGSSASSANSASGSASSATSASSSSAVQSVQAGDSGKTLVAYFSATGNTAPLAQYAADALDADLFEIEAAQPYTDQDLNYNDQSTRATTEQHDASARPEISGQLPDLDGYDTVVIAYPIWWGDEPRIVDTFVEGVDLSGKTVAAFCTSGGSGIGSSDKNLAALADPSATWLEGHRFAPGASQAEVESWLRSIGLL